MYVPRDITQRFKKSTDLYNIVAVVGARQAGKTTFLKEQAKHRNASYVLFDDPDARDIFEADIKKFQKQYIEGFDVTILDEVHYCKDAGPKLKYLADTGKKIWITSSSETLLGKEVLSYIVGRVSIITLRPFSLPEFFRARRQKESTDTIIRRHVWEHLTYGGYPKVVTTDDPESKHLLLDDLAQTLILKDVARIFSIQDTLALESFARYLAVNVGTILSYDTVSRILGMSFQTVKKYLDAMEKSYVIRRATPYFQNKNKEITKQPKLYFLDTGLRNQLAKTQTGEPDGHVFENYVYAELLKKGYTPRYWRTKAKAEVDFIIEKDDSVIPVEAKLQTGPPHIDRSLRAFIEAYEPAAAYVAIYGGQRGQSTHNGCTVTHTDVKDLLERL